MKTSVKKDYVLKIPRPAAKGNPSNPILTTLEFCDDPPPEVVFDGRSFCFTGVFEYENGDRLKCEAAVRARGGFCSARPTQTTNYIVLGTYADSSWTYGTFGKKILSAVEWKRAGANCKIISEKHWASFLQKAPELQKEKQIQFDGQTKNHQLIRLQEEVQQLQNYQKLIFDTLRKQLKPSDYKKLLDQLQKTGFPAR
jgi:hypothetical protein